MSTVSPVKKSVWLDPVYVITISVIISSNFRLDKFVARFTIDCLNKKKIFNIKNYLLLFVSKIEAKKYDYKNMSSKLSKIKVPAVFPPWFMTIPFFHPSVELSISYD